MCLHGQKNNFYFSNSVCHWCFDLCIIFPHMPSGWHHSQHRVTLGKSQNTAVYNFGMCRRWQTKCSNCFYRAPLIAAITKASLVSLHCFERLLPALRSRVREQIIYQALLERLSAAKPLRLCGAIMKWPWIWSTGILNDQTCVNNTETEAHSVWIL